MFQGSAHVRKGDHFALVEAAGGTMNGSTWFDGTNYFETMPAHQLELALWLEADRMGTLLAALDQANLDNQREVVKNEKRQRFDNQPYGSWLERLLEHLFPPGHPYHHSIIGSMEDLDAASLEDVRAFFRAHYVPDDAVLTIVGDCEAATARGLAERYFGGIPGRSLAGPGPVPEPPWSGETAVAGERRSVQRESVPLARIYLAYQAPILGDRRLDALDVACRILAAGQGSRLYRRLIRDERLVQEVTFEAIGLVAGASILFGSATLRPGIEVERVEAVIDEELARISSVPVTDDELARAKAQLETDELKVLQKVEERADRLSMYATLLDDPDLVNRMLERYQAVTADAIRDGAESVFGSADRVVLTYLPG
jgi:predicted Zn-dependent peptidase